MEKGIWFGGFLTPGMKTPALPLARPGLAKPCAFLETADLALLGGNVAWTE